MCPTEAVGMLITSVYKSMSFCWEAGEGWGEGKGHKAVDFKQGTERMGIRHHEQGTTFPNKGFFLLSIMHLLFFWCFVHLIKKDSLCRLKINDTSGTESRV